MHHLSSGERCLCAIGFVLAILLASVRSSGAVMVASVDVGPVVNKESVSVSKSASDSCSTLSYTYSPVILQAGSIPFGVDTFEFDTNLPDPSDLVGSVVEFGVELRSTVIDSNGDVIRTLKVPNGDDDCHSWNFTYMSYRAVTCRTSAQYWFLNDVEAYTDEATGIRMYDGRYCVAVGSYYANRIGTKLNLVMANGSVIKCIVGDQKADSQTDELHRYHMHDGSVVEMIIDYDYFKSTAQYPEGLRGSILAIQVIDGPSWTW